MALKKCLFCEAIISEFAEECPKCNTQFPFNQEKKEQFDLRQLYELEVNKEFICQQCNHTIKMIDALKRNSCRECGYRSSIKCFACKYRAITYDARQKEYVCFNHLLEECSVCKKLVSGDEKVLVRIESRYEGSTEIVCHEKCRTEVRSSSFHRWTGETYIK